MSKEKKILALIPQNVIPAVDGGKIGIYYPITMLAKEYKFKAIVFCDINEEVDQEAYTSLNIETEICRIDKRDKIINLLKNIGDDLPFKFSKYFSEKLCRKVIDVCKLWAPDIIICHHAHLANYCGPLKLIFPNTIFFLREHNVEYLLVEQFYKYETNYIKKYLAYWQYIKTKRFEINAWRLFDRVLFISDTDYREVKKEREPLKSAILYDGAEVRPAFRGKKNKVFLFTGSLNSIQNRVNLCKFIREVWIPWKAGYESLGYELWITGNKQAVVLDLLGMTGEECSDFSINILGFVDDIKKLIQESMFFLSPTTLGAGIRIKVVEALALGSVIFLTQPDLEMISSLKDQYNVILYSDVDSFNRNFLKLTDDNHFYNSISEGALEIAGQNLTWEAYFKKIKAFIDAKV
jgi:glycosyltransferase involved in cell wall biosynthesis